VRERTPVLLDWPASNIHGWGILGLNLFLNWAADRELRPLMGAPIAESVLDGLDESRALAIKDAIRESNRFQQVLAGFRAAAARLDTPVIKGFGNGLIDPGGVKGRPTIGRCIFEDTRVVGLDDKLADCDVVLCASRFNADLLKPNTKKRVEIIHEGVDSAIFRPRPRTSMLDPSRFYIFSGGKVEYRKGHDLVLLAFKEFSRRHDDAMLVTAWHSPWPQLSVGFKGKANARLELAADGTIHVKKWVAMNGINPDKVIEIKQVANPLLPSVLCNMHCALFVSRAEACTNLPAKEAMACGVPVVIAANTGMKDLIDEGNCLPLMKQDAIRDFTECGTEGWGESDLEEMVQALEKLYADTSYRQKIGSDGAAWIVAQGRTWANHARQLKSLVLSL
jgi:glycosyltransferase involved in cell wall biosynthesis